MLYYEIVRLDTNEPSDRDSFETVRKMVRRGWTRKAIEYLSDWDYGGETLDRARAMGEMRDTVLDNRSSHDRIVAVDGHYALCESHCPSGLYDAYYLVAGVTALFLASI